MLINSKILLFIGNHSEKFIDTFINIYAGVHYKDKFRYIRNVVYSNDVYEIYLIKTTKQVEQILIMLSMIPQ